MIRIRSNLENTCFATVAFFSNSQNKVIRIFKKILNQNFSSLHLKLNQIHRLYCISMEWNNTDHQKIPQLLPVIQVLFFYLFLKNTLVELRSSKTKRNTGKSQKSQVPLLTTDVISGRSLASPYKLRKWWC